MPYFFWKPSLMYKYLRDGPNEIAVFIIQSLKLQIREVFSKEKCENIIDIQLLKYFIEHPFSGICYYFFNVGGWYTFQHLVNFVICHSSGVVGGCLRKYDQCH